MDRLAARKRRYLEAIEKIEREERRLAEIDKEERKMKEELRKVQERLHAIHKEKSSINVSRHQYLANCCLQHVAPSTVNEGGGNSGKIPSHLRHKSAEQPKTVCRLSDEQKPEVVCFGGCCVHDKHETERACCAERRTRSSSSACSSSGSSVKSSSRKTNKTVNKCSTESSDAKPEKANVSKPKSSKSDAAPSRRSTAAVRPSVPPVVIPWDTVDESSSAVIADSPSSPAEDPRTIQITETYKASKSTEKLDLHVPCFKPDETRETSSVPPGDKVDRTPPRTPEVTCGSPISSPSPLPVRSRPWPLLPARCPTTPSTESSSECSMPPKRQCIGESRVSVENPVADSKAQSDSSTREIQSESTSLIPVIVGVNRALSGGDLSSTPKATAATKQHEQDPLFALLTMLEAEGSCATGIFDLLSRDTQSLSAAHVSYYETSRDADRNDRLAMAPTREEVDAVETEMETGSEVYADVDATSAEVIRIEPINDPDKSELIAAGALPFTDDDDDEELEVDVDPIPSSNPSETRGGEDLTFAASGHKIKIERSSPSVKCPATETSDNNFPSASSVKVELAEPSAVKVSPAETVTDMKLEETPKSDIAHREVKEEMTDQPALDRQTTTIFSQSESAKSASADENNSSYTVKTDPKSSSSDSPVRSVIPAGTRSRNSERRDHEVSSAGPIEPRILTLRDVIWRNRESLSVDVFVLPRRTGFEYRKYYVPEYDPRWARRAAAVRADWFPAPDYRNCVGRVDVRCKYPVHVGRGRRAFGVRFDGPPRLIELDGRSFVVPMGMALAMPPPPAAAARAADNGSANNRSLLAFGGPGHEVIIDGDWFSVPFGGVQKLVMARDGTLYSIRLPGSPPPSVVLLGELRLPSQLDTIDKRWHSGNYLNSPHGCVVKSFRHDRTTAARYWPSGEYAGRF